MKQEKMITQKEDDDNVNNDGPSSEVFILNR